MNSLFIFKFLFFLQITKTKKNKKKHFIIIKNTNY